MSASFLDGGPLLGLPAFERVLVIAAHPDDETIGCGGTIRLLANEGASVHVLFTSSGDATQGSSLSPVETARRREAEGRRAGDILGFKCDFMRLQDGRQARHVEAIASRIGTLMEALSPDVVFVPWLLDGHSDHRAVAKAVAMAQLPASTPIWGYETTVTVPANRLVDISSTVIAKEEALVAHETAALAFDLTASLGLNRWRAMHGMMGRGHAEAFLATSAAEWRETADNLGRISDSPLPAAGSDGS